MDSTSFRCRPEQVRAVPALGPKDAGTAKTGSGRHPFRCFFSSIILHSRRLLSRGAATVNSQAASAPGQSTRCSASPEGTAETTDCRRSAAKRVWGVCSPGAYAAWLLIGVTLRRRALLGEPDSGTRSKGEPEASALRLRGAGRRDTGRDCLR